MTARKMIRRFRWLCVIVTAPVWVPVVFVYVWVLGLLGAYKTHDKP